MDGNFSPYVQEICRKAFVPARLETSGKSPQVRRKRYGSSQAKAEPIRIYLIRERKPSGMG